ncbi:MAG: aminoacyl-tRNA hydrolase [Candidatus Beckwithbacteria bacterium]
MKLIVGLGNPGEKYKNNRHNVGFMVVDELAKLNFPGVVLFKPQKFMNRSGKEVKKQLRINKVRNLVYLYVVHDDLDIPLGQFKISQKGPKVHNGIKSVDEQLGFNNYWHVRVGIDNRRETGYQGSGEDYVLENFRPEEREVVKKVLEEILKQLGKLM